MFSKSILVVALYWTSIEATKYTNTEADLIALADYTFESWLEDNSKFFSPDWTRVVPYPKEVLAELDKMSLFQQTPFFEISMMTLPRAGLPERVVKYFEYSYRLHRQTSLLRKAKTLTENLIDILSAKHNGCSWDEISKVSNVQDIFERRSLIKISFDMVELEKTIRCFKDYARGLEGVSVLASRENVAIIDNLITKIDPKILQKFTLNPYDPNQGSIEMISDGIAKYMIQLEHPNLEEIPQTNLAETLSLLEQIFNSEIKEPASQLCHLTSGILGYFPKERFDDLFFAGELDRVNALEKRIEFSCDLASFPYASIRTRIWRDIFWISKIRNLGPYLPADIAM